MKKNRFLKFFVCYFLSIWLFFFIFFQKFAAGWFSRGDVILFTLVIDALAVLGLWGFSRSNYFQEKRKFIITSNKIPCIIISGFLACTGIGIFYREAVCMDYKKTAAIDQKTSLRKTNTKKDITSPGSDSQSGYESSYRTVITGSGSSRSDDDDDSDYDRDDDGGSLIALLIIIFILLIIGSFFIPHFWVLAGSLWIILLIFLIYWKQKYSEGSKSTKV